MFYVYQCEISDDRYFEVNCRGWDGVEWGRAYHDATMGPRDDQSADSVVIAAAVIDLYSHTKTVKLEDPEKVFEVLNIGADNYDEIVTSLKRSKSMSVGDVLITPDHKGYYCDRIGFVALKPETVKLFQCHVTTNIGSGESV